MGLILSRYLDFNCHPIDIDPEFVGFSEFHFYLDARKGLESSKLCGFTIDRNLGRGRIKKILGFAGDLGNQNEFL